MARHRAPLFALGMLSISLALAACAGTASTSPSAGVQGATTEPSGSASGSAASDSVQAGAEQQACAAIQTWSDEMRALVAMDASTASVDDVKAQADKIRASWEAVRASLQNVDATDEDAVVAAGQQLATGIDSFQTDVPVADAIAAVQTSALPLKNAYTEMANGLGCSIQNPY
jgi:hypothetical protein